MSTFGERVKEARIAAGLTQAQLATRSGFKNQSAIGNIENGKRDGSSNVVSLAKALNVEPEWLEKGSGPIRFTLSGPSLKIAQGFAALPAERQIALGPIIAAAIGIALSDEDFIDKFSAKDRRRE